MGTDPLAGLATQYLRDRSQLDAGQQQLDQRSSALTDDIGQQEQRIQDDSITYSANEFGLDCVGSVNLSNPDAYSACVNQEEQTASDAQNDMATATAQLAGDRQQLLALVTPLASEVGGFVQQLAELHWPTLDLMRDAERLSTVLATEQSDLEQEMNAYQGSNYWSGQHYSVQVTADGSEVANAALALDRALGLSSAGTATTALS